MTKRQIVWLLAVVAASIITFILSTDSMSAGLAGFEAPIRSWHLFLHEYR